MIALNNTEEQNLLDDCKRLKIQLAETKESLNSISSRQVIKDINNLNSIFKSALSLVANMTVDYAFHKIIKDFLGIAKSYDESNDKLSKETSEVIRENIQLGYKLEKLIRQKLYSNQHEETTGLAVAATNVSSNIIAAHLNAN